MALKSVSAPPHALARLWPNRMREPRLDDRHAAAGRRRWRVDLKVVLSQPLLLEFSLLKLIIAAGPTTDSLA